MGKLEQQVARNRDRSRRIDARFIAAPESGDRNLTFPRNIIRVRVSLDVYRRALNQSLVSGHPTPAHGSGRGVAGDVRGSWSHVTSETTSAQFVRSGRNIVRDALTGETGAVETHAVGHGDSPASVGDTSLDAQTDERVAWGVRDGTGILRTRSHFRFNHGFTDTDVREFAVNDIEGRLMTRLVLGPNTSFDRNEELRADVTFTFEGRGAGGSVITNDGIDAIADAIRTQSETFGMDELAFGRDQTDADPSQTALGDEVYRQSALRAVENERVVLTTRTDRRHPDPEQPVDLHELAVFDNSDPQRMMWRTTFSTLEKDDRFGFRTLVSFRIR